MTDVGYQKIILKEILDRIKVEVNMDRFDNTINVRLNTDYLAREIDVAIKLIANNFEHEGLLGFSDSLKFSQDLLNCDVVVFIGEYQLELERNYQTTTNIIDAGLKRKTND